VLLVAVVGGVGWYKLLREVPQALADDSIAEYLHNGSVPSLTDLLEPPARRPRIFYRGYDVYDRERVGFVSVGPDAEQHGVRYDTSQPGNSNQGHLWGTELAAGDTRALIEYLKTL
jgi:hypothetical protein